MHHLWLQRLSSLPAVYIVILECLSKRRWKTSFLITIRNKKITVAGGLRKKTNSWNNFLGEEQTILMRRLVWWALMLRAFSRSTGMIQGYIQVQKESQPGPRRSIQIISLSPRSVTPGASSYHTALCEVPCSVPFAHSQLMAARFLL